MLRLCHLPVPFVLLAACAPTGGGGDPGAVQLLDARGAAACVAPGAAETAAAVAATNSARASRGLAPVRGSAVLSAAAAQHACDMARRGRMTHQGSGGGGPSQRLKARGYRPAVTAENIAAGPYDLTEVLAAWSGSAGHRANILIPQLREVGIGQAVGADGHTRFWSAVYAAPR